MAIKFVAKKYYTFPELAKRWECDMSDIKQAIVDLKLVASIHPPGRYRQLLVFMNIGDGSLLPVSVLAEDFDPTGNAITDWIGGFVYLIWPRRMSAFDCSFTLIANKPTNFLENDFCYELDEPLNMEMVMRDGVVMNEEVERVEAIENQTNNLSQVDTPLSQIERKTLLTIIGAMLELLQKPRQSGSNQTTVIQSLLDSEHKHKTGIKERTLQEKFAAANQCLRSY